jgi:hypothetical protein
MLRCRISAGIGGGAVARQHLAGKNAEIGERASWLDNSNSALRSFYLERHDRHSPRSRHAIGVSAPGRAGQGRCGGTYRERAGWSAENRSGWPSKGKEEKTRIESWGTCTNVSGLRTSQAVFSLEILLSDFEVLQSHAPRPQSRSSVSRSHRVFVRPLLSLHSSTASLSSREPGSK